METQPGNVSEESLSAETPEDVAVLYSWANLHGAKYRDFSASRREYRAQVRHRAAEELRQAELQAQANAEKAAADAERAAGEAERAARAPETYSDDPAREEALRQADDAARVAAAERVEAARRAEAAAMAEAAARREEREIAEAHASAQRQAARWADSEVRRRSLAGPQPAPALIPGLASDPYVTAQGSGPEVDLYSPDTQLEQVQGQRYRGDATGGAGFASAERGAYRTAMADAEARRRPQGYRPDEASGTRPAFRGEEAAPERNRANNAQELSRAVPPATQGNERPGTGNTSQFGYEDARRPASAGDAPAWLYESQSSRPVVQKDATASPAAGAEDTLQHSRERVASRWYALKGAFEPGQEPEPPARRPEPQVPVLAVFSLAGGVGKTSLVATLGRAFSSMGEKVLLADTTSHGLLPYYFGASELRPGVVRTFSPPSGSADAAIHLVSYDVDAIPSDRASRDELATELLRVGAASRRALLDLNGGSSWLIRSLAESSLVILVPLAAEMNSVISLQGVERFFEGLADADGRPILPYYVINQYDASLPLHLDVREVLKRQLGDRLIPYMIRRAPAVSEALAEGMTVVDYAPGSPVAEDYMNVANWAKTVFSPATQGARNNRWSER